MHHAMSVCMTAAPSESAIAVIAQSFACDRALAEAVAANARYRSYPPRAIIVENGASVDALLMVIDGHARMVAFSVDGRLVVIRDFQRGDVIGESALLDAAGASDEVIAVDAVEAGAFPNAVFIALMTSHACIALAMSRLLIARLSATTQRLVEGATLSAVGRVHAELLRLARQGRAMTIAPPPVLAELARSVQTTRETVSRAISALEKRGIVMRNESALTLVAPHRLEELIY